MKFFFFFHIFFYIFVYDVSKALAPSNSLAFVESLTGQNNPMFKNNVALKEQQTPVYHDMDLCIMALKDKNHNENEKNILNWLQFYQFILKGKRGLFLEELEEKDPKYSIELFSFRSDELEGDFRKSVLRKIYYEYRKTGRQTFWSTIYGELQKAGTRVPPLIRESLESVYWNIFQMMAINFQIIEFFHKEKEINESYFFNIIDKMRNFFGLMQINDSERLILQRAKEMSLFIGMHYDFFCLPYIDADNNLKRNIEALDRFSTHFECLTVWKKFIFNTIEPVGEDIDYQSNLTSDLLKKLEIFENMLKDQKDYYYKIFKKEFDFDMYLKNLRSA